MLKELSIFTKTYKQFLKYVFYKICNENNNKYKTFPKSGESFIVICLINFLEDNGTPITEAISFYSYSKDIRYYNQVKVMIAKEFYRIENNLNCNYTPF